jgi:lysozyme family protein
MNFEPLKDEYTRLWASMVVRSSFKSALDTSARKILAGKQRYSEVSELTGVPWFVIGLIHQMEAGCKWGCHLHNGDPLSARTRRVPARRPAVGNAPFTWEASACDALMMKNMQSIKEWSIERIAYELERYNGWGYRKYHKAVLSPYLWSGTTHYARGKYVADGKWSSTAVSGQTGAIPLLKSLMALDPSITLGALLEEVKQEPEETAPDSFGKADEKQVSKPVVAAGACTAGGLAMPFLPSIPAPPVEAVSSVAGWQTSVETIGSVASSKYVLATVVALVFVGWVLPAMARRWGSA